MRPISQFGTSECWYKRGFISKNQLQQVKTVLRILAGEVPFVTNVHLYQKKKKLVASNKIIHLEL